MGVKESHKYLLKQGDCKNQKMVTQLSLNKDYHRISDQNYGAKNGEGSGWVDLVQYIKISVISNFAKRLNSVPCKIVRC